MIYCERLRLLVRMQSKYDISVKVNGGGVTGQTEAVRLGVSRALVLINGDWISAFASVVCSPAMPA